MHTNGPTGSNITWNSGNSIFRDGYVRIHRTQRTNERTIVRFLVFSNRDFTSTLYSGMRASCATSADLRRPLPHYLVHALRSVEMPRRRNSIAERPAYRDYPRRRLSQSLAKLALARVCFPSIPLLARFASSRLTWRISSRSRR